MEQTRIALVQMESIVGETHLNLEKMKGFIQEAAAGKADLICFPELSVHGYSRDSAHLPAEPAHGESSRLLSRLAREAGLVVLAGLAEKSAGARPYITQLVLYPDGRVQKYRKTHLGGSEQPYYTAGDELPLFQGGKVNFAVEICWDLHFPEVTAILSLKGCELVFAPHASPTIVGDRRKIWLKYLAARAYDNTVFLAACNLTGSNGAGHTFCGGAMVLDPKGNIVAEDFSGGDKLLVADLDPGVINTIRNKHSRSMRHIYYLGARRPELYGDLTKE
jgi:predicted amidohydrolase